MTMSRRMSINCKTLPQTCIDWLLGNGVSAQAIINPSLIDVAHGMRGADGRFDPVEDGPQWFAIPEEDDLIFWRPRTGEIATEHGHAFALGQGLVKNPGATALGDWLRIFEDPLAWLKNDRTGIVVLHWEWAFEWLRDVPQIAVAEGVLAQYRRHMTPRLPRMGVIPREQKKVAA